MLRRRDALERLALLERPGDAHLTQLTRVASHVSRMPAAIHILGELEQHRIAATAAPLGDHPRYDAPCRVAVDEDSWIVTRDATEDDRLTFSSLVRTQVPPIRGYAAFPLRAQEEDVAIGTLCVWSASELDLDEDELALLEILAQQAMTHLELQAQVRDLRHAASHDPLTGLANRRLLDDRLAQALSQRRRHSSGEVLVVLLDVNLFKQVNDTFGHDVGDDVLVRVARRLRTSVRAEDTVARLGGDEFAVLAEAPDADEAQHLVARISEMFAEPVTVPACPAEIFVSVGWALAGSADDVRDVLDRADHAMYEVKQQSRSAR